MNASFSLFRPSVLTAPLACSIAALVLASHGQAVASDRTVQIGGLSLTVPETESLVLPSSGDSRQQPESEKYVVENTDLPAVQASEFLVLNGTGESNGNGIRVLKAAYTGMMTPSENALSRSSRGGDAVDRMTLEGHGGLPTFFGTSLGWRFSEHFGVRAGYDWFSFSRNQSLSDLKYNLKLKMQSEPLFVDLYPWQNRSFRLSAGVLFNQNSFTGSLNPSANVNLGGQVYTPAQVGSLHIQAKQRAVCPIVSMGGNLFYFDSAHQWGFSYDLGAYFAGKPDVQLSTTSTNPNVIKSAADERDSLRRGIGNKLNIIPVIQTGINFSF